MTHTFDTAVLAAEKLRCAAMLVGDIAALETLLDPRLQFHHATGAVDDKPAYLAKMSAGRITYVAIEWSDERVIALGDDAAVLVGRMVTDVRVEGADKRLNNRVTTVWSSNAGAWRLVVFQSTPL